MLGSLCVQTGKGLAKPGRVGHLSSVSNAWNFEELSKDQRHGFLGESPALLLRGRYAVVSGAFPSLGVLCMTLGNKACLGLERPVVNQGQGADSLLPPCPFPLERLTIQQSICSFVTRGDPVRDCRWSYARRSHT